MESQSIAIQSERMLLLRSVPIENNFQMSLIQVTGTNRNTSRPKQQPTTETKLFSIHSKKTQILRSVPIENHFQISLLQVTHTGRNTLCPKQQPTMEQKWTAAQTHEILTPKSLPNSNPSRMRQLTRAPKLQKTISLTNRSRHGHPRLKVRLTSKRCGPVRSQQSSDARQRFFPSTFSLLFRDEVHQNPESPSTNSQTALT
jgi:hypothetical protein